jgi:hypothetical protein
MDQYMGQYHHNIRGSKHSWAHAAHPHPYACAPVHRPGVVNGAGGVGRAPPMPRPHTTVRASPPPPLAQPLLPGVRGGPLSLLPSSMFAAATLCHATSSHQLLAATSSPSAHWPCAAAAFCPLAQAPSPPTHRGGAPGPTSRVWFGQGKLGWCRGCRMGGEGPGWWKGERGTMRRCIECRCCRRRRRTATATHDATCQRACAALTQGGTAALELHTHLALGCLPSRRVRPIPIRFDPFDSLIPFAEGPGRPLLCSLA